MGLEDEYPARSRHLLSEMNELIRSFYQPQLQKLELTKKQIEGSTSREQLEHSLVTVEDAISNAEHFNPIYLVLPHFGGRFSIKPRQHLLV
jgi:hypothetical protein